MSSSQSEDELLQKFSDFYSKAEGCIKHYELGTKEICVPAINQLRYAGHHLAKYYRLHESSDRKLQLEKAINHCRRAYYDVKEAVLMEALERIDSFFEVYIESDYLTSEYPKWREHRQAAREAKSSIENIREKTFEDRTDMFDQIDPHLDRIESIGSGLGDVSNRLAILENRRRQKLRKETRRFIITVLISLIGLTLLVWRVVSEA